MIVSVLCALAAVRAGALHVTGNNAPDPPETPAVPRLANGGVYMVAGNPLDSGARFIGEFHDGWRKPGDVLQYLSRTSCKQFYRPANPNKFKGKSMAYDRETQLFRPATEIHPAKGQPNLTRIDAGPAGFRRMLTYEDIAVPLDFHTADKEVNEMCVKYAIRTPQRPVKTLTCSTKSGQRMMMPSIWKCGSTSLTRRFQAVSSCGVPHVQNVGWCGGSNTLAQCEKHTTFLEDAASGASFLAAVRNPLDRFLASVYEHGVWETCNGTVCSGRVNHARDFAKNIAANFPHILRTCHIPTQSYFLSSTDVSGNPYKWDFLMRLDDFDEGLRKIISFGFPLDRNFTEQRHITNDSGEKSVKQMYFDAVFSDLATLCRVCKVYAQDFECLGYVVPARCTKAQCATVDVDLGVGGSVQE